MAIRLKLKGNKALLKGLENASKKTKQMVGDEIEASTYNIQADASSHVPVDTGFLKSSINAETDRANLIGQVETSVKYAPYIEFGTGGRVNIPQGLEAYASQFKGKGVKQVNMPPQPFLFPASFKEFPKLIQRINKGLNKEF